MKDKIYINVIPKNCWKCKYCSSILLSLVVNKPNTELHCAIDNESRFFDKNNKPMLLNPPCPLKSLKTHDLKIINKIIKFINELAWKDVQFDANQSTMGEFIGSTSAIPRYAKKYFDLWKDMFGEDLNKKEQL